MYVSSGESRVDGVTVRNIDTNHRSAGANRPGTKAGGMPLALRGARIVACAVVVGCAVAACGQPDATPRAPSPQQECVQAVFDVLSGMVSRPYDNRPFADFVTRYGTQSVPYSAYLDVFTSFRSLSASQGVHGAENRLRAIVTRDCAGAS